MCHKYSWKSDQYYTSYQLKTNYDSVVEDDVEYLKSPVVLQCQACGFMGY